MIDAGPRYPVLFRQEQRLRVLDTTARGPLKPSSDASVVAVKLTGKVDRQRLLTACRHALGRGPGLSVRFEREGDGYIQTTVERPQIEIRDDINFLEDLQRGKIGPFRLDDEATLRLTLVPTTPNSTALVAELDHIAVDEWAMRLFLNEISQCYVAMDNKPLPRTAEADGTYFDLVQEQRAMFTAGKQLLEDRLSWWSRHIVRDTLIPVITEFCRTSVAPMPPYRNESCSMQTTVSVDHLRATARDLSATPFEVTCACVLRTLAEMTGIPDAGVITSVANRDARRQQKVIGLLAEPRPLVLNLSRDSRIKSLIPQIRESLGPDKFVPFPLLLKQFAPDFFARPLTIPRIDLKVETRNSAFKLRLPGVECDELPVDDGGYQASWMLTVDCSNDKIKFSSVFDRCTFIPSKIKAFLAELAHTLAVEASR